MTIQESFCGTVFQHFQVVKFRQHVVDDQVVRGVDHRYLHGMEKEDVGHKGNLKKRGVGRRVRQPSKELAWELLVLTVDELITAGTLPTGHLATIAWWRAAG